MVRTWQGKDDEPGGTTGFWTNAAVQQPLQLFDDDDDRSRMENRWTQGSQAAVEREPSAAANRAGGAGTCDVHPARVHVTFTLRRFALATTYRLPCEREALGGEPVGWQRGRCQLLEQHRDTVIVCAHG